MNYPKLKQTWRNYRKYLGACLDGELWLRVRTSRKHERHARGERLPLVELRDERKKWEGDVMPREVSRKRHVFCRTKGHVRSAE